MTHTLIYLYGIIGQPLKLTVNGIDGAQVRWIESSGLVAAVSDVTSAEFEEEPLNERVRDMAWLAPRAIAHQEVNERLFETTDAIVPLAFGTVFRDDQRVRHLLSVQATSLKQQLQRVRGRGEWVVTLHVLGEPDVKQTPSVQAMREQIEASPPGRAHLLRRQLATLERSEARRLNSEAAAQVYAALERIADDVFREPLPADAVERPLLRASVLVRRDRDMHFADAIDGLRERWPEPTFRLVLTGPWPPYRFAGLPQDGA